MSPVGKKVGTNVNGFLPRRIEARELADATVRLDLQEAGGRADDDDSSLVPGAASRRRRLGNRLWRPAGDLDLLELPVGEERQRLSGDQKATPVTPSVPRISRGWSAFIALTRCRRV